MGGTDTDVQPVTGLGRPGHSWPPRGPSWAGGNRGGFAWGPRRIGARIVPWRQLGGISTAIEARVDETILYLQSGHGAALPARAYMQIASPARFLEMVEAFGL